MIAKRFGDVPLYPPVRVLINSRRYQASLLLQKLLIIRHLNVHIHMELVLEPLCEVELENMANMHRPTRPSTSIEEETLPLLIIVQDQVQVAVGEEYLAPDQIRRVA